MKKNFFVVACVALGCLIMFVGMSESQNLPGIPVTNEVETIIAGLQGRCKSYDGSTCKVNEGQVASNVCKIGVTNNINSCVGACEGAKHDTLDTTEAGEATMSNEFCCNTPFICCAVMGPSNTIIGGVPVERSQVEGISCTGQYKRNKCTQNQ
ncbi:MAG: hypothetical protein LBP59_17530 [Planctomycetaceae bacterium]|jgi:hypothetical protein|nr:hypothetical protein [Planctomycetaceae bacterium]